MDKPIRFKPLWLIHNRVYHQKMRHVRRNQLAHDFRKIMLILRLRAKR